MALYVKKTATSVFIIGLLALTIFSVLGTIYLTKMAYSKDDLPGITQTEKNIARLAIVTIWLQFTWIILGSILQNVWKA